MKAALSVGLIAIVGLSVAGGCVVKRTKSSANADVMDLDNAPSSHAEGNELGHIAPGDPGGIEPLTTTTPPAPQPTPPVAEPRTHIIAAGDTLWSLAVKYYGDGKQLTKIQDANPGLEPTRMPIGKKIVIP